jgi:hypothetical protein
MPNSRSTLQTVLQMLIACAVVSTVSPLAAAQDSDPIFQTGRPSFSPTDTFPGGSVNFANGNLHIEIPLGGSAQRGSLPINLNLVYDSRYVWQPVYDPTGIKWTTTQGTWGTAGHIQALGWRIVGGADNVSADNYSPSAVETRGQTGRFHDSLRLWHVWPVSQ